MAVSQMRNRQGRKQTEWNIGPRSAELTRRVRALAGGLVAHVVEQISQHLGALLLLLLVPDVQRHVERDGELQGRPGRHLQTGRRGDGEMVKRGDGETGAHTGAAVWRLDTRCGGWT